MSGRCQQVHDPGLGCGRGHGFDRSWHLLREAVSGGFGVVSLSRHHCWVLGRRGIDERSEGLLLDSFEKIEIWGLERYSESVEGIQAMALDVRTYDGAHVALKDSPVSVGHRLGSATLSVHLFASPSEIPSANLLEDRCCNHDWMAGNLLEVEE